MMVYKIEDKSMINYGKMVVVLDNYNEEGMELDSDEVWIKEVFDGYLWASTIPPRLSGKPLWIKKCMLTPTVYTVEINNKQDEV